ncbi:hypothetical protein SDC9_140680 [bioreactor metagenome]|uniref:Uncharacterized protein n=1 Tax=bioreactor metagenome TaxID=1076179 RepID=A0A645DW33_9ZZZZ
MLAALEDLLPDDPGVRRQLAQPDEVAARVAQPVGVVHPQAVDLSVGDPPGDPGVGGGEHRRVLLTQPGQGGDGEEPPVGDLGVAAAPGDQPVVLPAVDGRGRVTRLPGALGDRVAVAEVVQLHPVRGLDQGEVLVAVLAEHRQQDRVTTPVDVVPGGVRGVPALLEHAPPARVLGGLGDPQVIGDDVDDDPDAGRVGRLDEFGPGLFAAPLVVDPGRVDAVVAVLGAGRRGEHRGEVERAHPQVTQVAHHRGGIAQGVLPGDLQSVGRGGGAHRLSFRRSLLTLSAPGIMRRLEAPTPALSTLLEENP